MVRGVSEMIQVSLIDFYSYLIPIALFIFILTFYISWNYHRTKHYVLEWDKNNVGKLYKAKKLSDLLLQIKKDRYVAITNPAITDNNKRYYFAYQGDLHTVDIRDGKVISDDMLKEYKNTLLEEIAKNLKAKGKKASEIKVELEKTFKPRIEAIPPHKFTNLVIAKIVQRKVFESLLMSLVRSNLFMYILLFVSGLLLGLVINQYMILYNQFPILNKVSEEIIRNVSRIY